MFKSFAGTFADENDKGVKGQERIFSILRFAAAEAAKALGEEAEGVINEEQWIKSMGSRKFVPISLNRDPNYRTECSLTIACIDSDRCWSAARDQNSSARVRASSQTWRVLTVGRGSLMGEFRRLPLAGGA